MSDTPDLFKIQLYNLANDRGKFALDVRFTFGAANQEKFEGLLLSGMVVLMDICPLAAAEGRLCRVFMLGDALRVERDYYRNRRWLLD